MLLAIDAGGKNYKQKLLQPLIAMTILWAYGYTDVLSMRGGVAEWVKAGYPVVDYVPQP